MAIPGLHRLRRLPGQLARANPFQGDIRPQRVPLLAPFSSRPTLPFPHPWNYKQPIQILETYFWQAQQHPGTDAHNRYIDFPGLYPVLVTRDPALIRAIAADTGDKPGQFDRDTMPSVGIARATGKDTLLYANGPAWKHQKKLASPPFGKSSLFQPEQFNAFAETFRATARSRLTIMRERYGEADTLRVRLDDEIKIVMLELLVNNFFGADISYERFRDRYVPALEKVISHIVTDTVVNRVGCPLHRTPTVSGYLAEVKQAQAAFEELTDIALSTRSQGKGLWAQFKSEATDEQLRGNIRVFLAGALEATTSYASWALAHLARHTAAQDALHDELQDIEDYSPEGLGRLTYLNAVLDETLRLTPSLYFMPRQATVDRWVETSNGRRLLVPRGTHILLDVWHANRHEDFWGEQVTGYPADEFHPERWTRLSTHERRASDLLHFGFGHGPRFCPGQHLGQLEVALAVGAFVKLFRFRAVDPALTPVAGVSTKPGCGVEVDISPRDRAQPSAWSTNT